MYSKKILCLDVDVSEEASETETDVPMKTQEKSGEETPKVKAELNLRHSISL